MKQAFAATWHAKKTVLFKAKGVVALEFAALQKHYVYKHTNGGFVC